MSIARIAIRYATPLLDLAIEQKVEDAVKTDMEKFIGLCDANRDLLLLLESPIIPHLRKAGIIRAIFTGKVNELTMNFFEIVVTKSRENFLVPIAEEYLRLYNIHKGIQEATIKTSMKLDAKTKSDFEDLVKKLTDKKPLLREEIDPAIIGGYELAIGDRKIDATVSGQIRAMRLKFNKGNN